MTQWSDVFAHKKEEKKTNLCLWLKKDKIYVCKWNNENEKIYTVWNDDTVWNYGAHFIYLTGWRYI